MPPSFSSRNSLRSAGVSAPIFIGIPEHVNTVTSQYGESMEEQPQSESTGLGAQMTFVDDYP